MEYKYYRDISHEPIRQFPKGISNHASQQENAYLQIMFHHKTNKIVILDLFSGVNC